jgi:hypothetical protein
MHRLLIAVVCSGLASCGERGTFVHLYFEISGSPPANATTIDLELTLGGTQRDVAVSPGGPLQLPTDLVLDVRSGEGDLTVSATLRDTGGAALATASAMGELKRGATLDLTLRFISGGGGDLGDDGPRDVAVLSIDNQPEYDFGTVVVNTMSASATLTVTNVGTMPSGPLGATTTTDPTQFIVVTDGCVGQMLMPMGTCTLVLRFDPKSEGVMTSAVSVAAMPGGTTSTNLKGTSVAPGVLVFTPSMPNFVATIGQADDEILTLKNTGGAATGAITLQMTGAAFNLTTNNCDGMTLAPGAECTATVRFTASAPAGMKGGSLVANATPGGPGVAQLNGVAEAPALLQVTPAGSFGVVDAGTTREITFMITNAGDQPSGDLSPQPWVSGTRFSQVSTTCVAGAPLAPKTSCNVVVRFSPVAYGNQSGALTLSASPGGSINHALSGTGRQSFTLTVAKNGSGTGSVTGTGFNCDLANTDCSEVYAVTTAAPTVTLTAVGNPADSNFVSWAGQSGCTTAAGCTVTVDGTKTVTATFNLRQYTVTVNREAFPSNTGGTITSLPSGISCPGTCSASFNHGVNVQLTRTVSNNQFHWRGGCTQPINTWGTSATCNTGTLSGPVTVYARHLAFNYAFVTSATYNGQEVGALTAADDKCNNLAIAAGLPGASTTGGVARYIAYLSTASPQVNARDRILQFNPSAQGWIRTDGLPFTDTIANLTNNQKVYYPLRYTEISSVTPEFSAWTGTTYDGTTQLSPIRTCNDWTDSTGSSTGEAGVTGGSSGRWVRNAGSGVTCSATQRRPIYCFGTTRSTALTFTSATGRRAFLSTGTVNLGTGRATADNLCRTEAAAAGLPNASNYLAAMATTTESAMARFNLTGQPWVRSDGVRLAATPAQFLGASHSLEATLNVSASGTTYFWAANSNRAAVGSQSPDARAATAASDSCNDWGPGGTTALYGDVDITNAHFWGLSKLVSCSTASQVYCLEP